MTALRTASLIVAAAAVLHGGSVAGRVIDAHGGSALSGAEVSLVAEASSESGEALLLTRRSLPDGRFTFEDVPAGSYLLGFSKGGYEGGSRGSMSVALTDSEPEVDVDLELRRSGVLGGHVTDPDGDPIQDAIISLREWNTVQGRRKLRQVSSSRTDDRGTYRIHNLRPGKYIVTVMPRSVVAPRGVLAYEFGPVSYPNATTPAGASPVEVRWGALLESIDFRLDWSPDTAISGAAMAAEGGRCNQCFVNLADDGGGIIGAVSVSDDGYFAIRGAQPGQYRLTMRARRTQQIASARVFVSEGKPAKAVLQPTDGVWLSGRVVLEGAPDDEEDSSEKAQTLSIQVLSFDGSRSPDRGTIQRQVRWRDGEEFKIEGLSPGDYYLNVVRSPSGSYVREFLLAGQPLPAGVFHVGETPITDLEIRLAFDAGSVAGKVQNHPPSRNRGPLGQGLVVLLPDNYGEGPYVELLGGYRASDGEFSIPNVPPGSYRVFAVLRDNNYDLGDPEDVEFLRRKGRRVQVGARATTNAPAPFVANR